MVGILLTVLAVLLVIVLAFCHSEQTRSPRELPFLNKNHKKGH
jgi:hypothetical protein